MSVRPPAPAAQEPRSKARLGFFALIGGATGIGFAPVLVRLTDTGPTATAFYRLLIALPLLWVWAWVDRRKAPAAAQPQTRRDFGLLILSGLLFAGDLSIWHWSLQFTSVTNSTLLTNLAPIFVTIGARLLFHEPIRPAFVVGMVIAIAGASMLVGTSLNLNTEHLWGDVLSVIAAVFYGGYLLTVKRLRTQFRTPTIMAWSGMVSCPAFAAIALLSGDSMLASSPQGWMAVTALALVSHVAGQTLIAYGFGHLPASFSSVSLLWQPVVAAGVAWVVLHEPLRWMQGLGAVIVLAGIALASTGRNSVQSGSQD